MEPILLILGTLAAIIVLPLTWIIAKRQGVFDRSEVKIQLHGLPENGGIRPELIIGGPHSKHNILTPILVSVSNIGTATASDIEVAIEANSSVVVNHPAFFISPVATSSAESMEGATVYIGKGVFRRVFKIAQLHPGKTVQLNNVGLPRNALSTTQAVANCSLAVSIYEKGRTARKLEFGIWHLDTSEDSFQTALRKLSQKTKNEFGSKSRLQRFFARLQHRKNTHPLQLIEITTVREVSTPGEADAFVTVGKFEESSGVRLVTGHLFVGSIGLI
jgi:hypothetical protein